MRLAIRMHRMNKAFSFAHSTVLHIKDNPYLPCSSAIKFHSITPTYHTDPSLNPRLSIPDFFSKAARQNPERRAWVRGYTDPALLMHCTVSAYSQNRPYLPCSVQYLHCSNPQHNSLSMHIKMHYTPTTTDPTAFNNPPLHTTDKHKAYLYKWRQNGTRCRDGVKVLWCHSHLV